MRLLLAASLLTVIVALAPSAAHEGGGDPGGSAGDGPALSNVHCEDGSAAGFPCQNIDLRAFVPVTDLGTSRLNDLWGWTDPLTGVEWALVGTNEGVDFVSLAHPDQPVLVGHLPAGTAASLWGDQRVYADHAFFVKESAGHGLQVFDLNKLRDVTNPPVTFVDDGRYTGFGNSHTFATNVATGLGAALGTNTCSGGLHLLDLSDPVAPAFLGCFAADGYTHDAECVLYSGPDTQHRGREICFASNVDTVTIVDVTNPAAPVQLSRTSYPGVGFVHQGWLTPDQRYFLQNDEFDERDFGHETRTYVWDISNLDAPVWRGFHAHETTGIDHNLVVVGNHVYEANYRAGVRVLRTGHLARAELAEVAFLDTIPADDAVDYSGVWGVHVFESGLVIASDIFGGLFVLEPHLEAIAECEDGIDNDVDGTIDASGGPGGEPFDSGCASPSDPVEGAPPAPMPSGCGVGPELVPLLALLAGLRKSRRRAGRVLTMARVRTLPLVLLGVLASAVPASGAVDLPPDLTVDPAWLVDHDVSWGIQPGCAHLRLSAATPNVGLGPLEIYGALPANPDGTQDVYQRILRDDGTWWDRLAGLFVFHSGHEHVHFEDWAVYRLRADLGGTPGGVLTEGEKTSFCLLDSSPYDLGLPGAPASRVFTVCDGIVQGISVGWEDVYRKTLPGQSIPLCGIANGSYWVEAEVDPLNRILEADETNNADAILVSIEIPPAPACNDGVDNDSDGQVDYPGDATCAGLTGASEGFLPTGGCGLGPELAPVLALLVAVRRRGR
jgi:choice-of-anchor B domain-containing protein